MWQRIPLGVLKWAVIGFLALWAMGALADPSFRPLIAIGVGVYIILTRIDSLEKRLIDRIKRLAARDSD